MNAAQAGEPPVITVTRGSATPAELAAVVAVLLAVRATAAGPPARPGSRTPGWAARGRTLTAFPHPGPGGWRASALPR